MSMIEKYQSKTEKEIKLSEQIVAENNQDNKTYQVRTYKKLSLITLVIQVEMRREFFHLLQIREIILENNRN